MLARLWASQSLHIHENSEVCGCSAVSGVAAARYAAIGLGRPRLACATMPYLNHVVSVLCRIYRTIVGYHRSLTLVLPRQLIVKFENAPSADSTRCHSFWRSECANSHVPVQSAVSSGPVSWLRVETTPRRMYGLYATTPSESTPSSVERPNS